jgi:hypothetical protein
MFKVKKYFLYVFDNRRHKIHILIICVLLLYENQEKMHKSWHDSMNHK